MFMAAANTILFTILIALHVSTMDEERVLGLYNLGTEIRDRRRWTMAYIEKIFIRNIKLIIYPTITIIMLWQFLSELGVAVSLKWGIVGIATYVITFLPIKRAFARFYETYLKVLERTYNRVDASSQILMEESKEKAPTTASVRVQAIHLQSQSNTLENITEFLKRAKAPPIYMELTRVVLPLFINYIMSQLTGSG